MQSPLKNYSIKPKKEKGNTESRVEEEVKSVAIARIRILAAVRRQFLQTLNGYGTEISRVRCVFR